jgi:hypothetical protein
MGVIGPVEVVTCEQVAVVTDVKPVRQEVAPVQIFPAVAVHVPGAGLGDAVGIGVAVGVGVGVGVGVCPVADAQ